MKQGGSGLKKKYLKSFTGRLITAAFFAVLQVVVFMAGIAALGNRWIAVSAVFNVLSVIVVVVIINTRRNPAYKLAWALLILGMPLFGGLMYFVAALQSSTIRFRKKAASAKKIIQPYMKQNPAILDAMRAESRTKANHATYLANKADYPVYANTTAVYFPSGEDMFEWLLPEFERARKFIFIESFIIQEGLMWDSIFKVLIKKAREGVDVRVMWDGVGCMGTLPKNYDKTLEALGIKTCVFNPFMPIATVIQNNRDHRKIIVIDGLTGLTGGVNLADEYINAYDRFGHWKDSAILIRGDAVMSMTMTFLESWYMYKPADPDPRRFIYRPLPNDFAYPAGAEGYVQPYADTPLDGECVGELVYFNLINKAKDYIWLTTPYLIPDNELVTALCFAAKSGIDVRIITPHIPDKWYVFEVTRSFYGELIDSGVKIYEYTPGFIHGKICVSDDSIAVVGSLNLDYRSLYLHFEDAALIYDCPAVADVKRDFMDTMSRSEEITKEKYLKMRKRSGLLMSVLRVLAPLF